MRLKTAISILTLLCLSLQIAQVSLASPLGSPLIGRWTLDVSSLSMPPERRPKSVLIDFHETPDSKWATSVEIIDQNNKKMTTTATLDLNGAPGKASGTYWVDVVAATMPEPNVLVMQIVYQGIPRSTRVFSVSADGNRLTETETYFKDDSTPVQRIGLFSRVAVEP